MEYPRGQDGLRDPYKLSDAAVIATDAGEQVAHDAAHHALHGREDQAVARLATCLLGGVFHRAPSIHDRVIESYAIVARCAPVYVH